MTLPDTDTLSAHWVEGLSVQYVVKPPAVPQLWVVKHDVTLPDGNWRSGLPEVHRLLPFHHVVLTEKLQWLWRDINPDMTTEKVCKLFGNGLAFCNGSGFPGHANHLLGEELDKDNPRFDQARICGGGGGAEKKDDDQELWIEKI